VVGTSWRFSARRCAVTVTSWIPPFPAFSESTADATSGQLALVPQRIAAIAEDIFGFDSTLDLRTLALALSRSSVPVAH